MWCALPPCIACAQADPRTRVVVVQGAQPGMFAAGADISEFERTYSQPAEAAIAAREIQDGIDAVQACRLPVVALIDGPCVGDVSPWRSPVTFAWPATRRALR